MIIQNDQSFAINKKNYQGGKFILHNNAAKEIILIVMAMVHSTFQNLQIMFKDNEVLTGLKIDFRSL